MMHVPSLPVRAPCGGGGMMRGRARHGLARAVFAGLLAMAPAAATAQVLTMEAARPEAKEGQGQGIELLLMLDKPAGFPFLAQVNLAGVDADAGSDFMPPVIPVTFAGNDVRRRAVIDTVDDPFDEPYRETFVATVASVTPLDPQAVPNIINAAGAIPLTVIDDDNAFSVSARPGPEGGAAVLTIRQQYDSGTEETVIARPAAGSATPGLDFEPWLKVARFPPGKTETSVAIGLMPDSMPEEDETFPVEMAHIGTGTASFEPATVTGTILDKTEDSVAVRIEGGPVTITLEIMGETTTRQTEFPGYEATLTRHVGGTRLTLSQPDRMDLEFHRICTEDTDFKAIAEEMPGISAADVGAGNATGWRGRFVEGTYEQEWTMFEAPDGGFTGYTRMQDDIQGARMRGWNTWRLIPLQEEAPDVPRLPADPPEPQLPPGAVADAVGRQVAEDLGTSPEDVAPYLSTSLGPDMTTGDGDSPRAVEVEIWLDADRRPILADRAAIGPCDPDHGKARAAAKRLRYRLGTAGDATIIGQAVVQDVATGVLEEAYMEDFGNASNSLDTAVERAHDGLAPSLGVPE